MVWGLKPDFAARLIKEAGLVFERVVRVEPDKGGLLYVGDLESGAMTLSMVFGENLEEGMPEFHLKNTEMVSVLLSGFVRDYSSRQIVPQVEAVAIRGKNLLIAFSGFSPEMNEAIALLLAVRVDELYPELAEMVENPTFEKLRF